MISKTKIFPCLCKKEEIWSIAKITKCAQDRINFIKTKTEKYSTTKKFPALFVQLDKGKTSVHSYIG